MKNRHSPTILSLMAVIFLFGYGCRTGRQSASESAEIPKKTRTTVTKENLKSRLSGKKVKFIEKEGDADIRDGSEIGRREMSPLKLRIVTGDDPPKVEFMEKVHEFTELLARFKYMGRTESVTLPATESDLALYNDHGITVEDFEFVIRNLDEYIDEFKVDFLGQQTVPRVSPRSKIDGFPSTKPELPKADDLPPPPRKSTP